MSTDELLKRSTDTDRPARRRLLIVLVVVLSAVAVLVAGYWVVTTPRAEPVKIERVVLLDERTIRLEYVGGSCDDHYDLQIEQDDQVVTATVRRTLKRVRSCDDMGYSKAYDVVLDEPLGDRPVVDGSRDYVPRMVSPSGETLREHTRPGRPMGG